MIIKFKKGKVRKGLLVKTLKSSGGTLKKMVGNVWNHYIRIYPNKNFKNCKLL